MPRSGAVRIRVTGLVKQGTEITPCDGIITLPAATIEAGEVVYRVALDLANVELAASDLLVVQPRSRAATGEFVIATLGDRAFIGRWWTKHGRRALLDNAFSVIVESRGLLVLGAITLIVRDETR